MKRLKRYFLTGFLVVAPISISLMVLLWFVSALDQLLAPLVAGVLGRHIGGLGVIAALAILLGAGFLSSNMVGQHVVELLEELLLRIPGFSWLYRTVKQMADVFSPESKTKFQSVVLVEYPRPDILSLGFVTNRVEIERDGRREELALVYIPTNHLYIGDIILVPGAKLLETGLSMQEGAQALFSAGAAVPRVLPVKRLPPSRPEQ